MQNTWSQGGVVPLTLQVQVNSIPVSGLMPTVEVVRHPDYFVADWKNNVFVAPVVVESGRALMSQVPSGDGSLYVREFDRSKFAENDPRAIYFARYRVVIPSGNVVCTDTSLSTHETHVFELDTGLFANFSS